MSDQNEEKSIVEKVFEERNLVTSTVEIPKESPMFSTTRGNVRIEGEITEAKLKLASDFDKVFTDVTREIEDLAPYVPNPRVLDLIKSGAVSEPEVKAMKAAQAWTIFTVKGEALLKTPDLKLESVKEYCFRLEKAVLAQVNLRKQTEDKYKNSVNFLQEQLNNQVKANKIYEDALQKYTNAKIKNEQFTKTFYSSMFWDLPSKLVLHLKTSIATMKPVLLKLFGEEQNNE